MPTQPVAMRLVSISAPATLVAALLAAAFICTITTASYAATDHAKANHAHADAAVVGVGDDACSSGCLSFFPTTPAVQATCELVCSAVEAQSDTPCGQALLGSSFEHLTLLSYSSGHVVESLAILLGALGGNSSSVEDAAFFSDLHLNDRGSPQACGDVADAHYCLGQLPLVASIGVCLPQSCDSASVLALLASVNASSLLPSATSDDDPATSAASFVGSTSFTCGDELRVYRDAGTVSVLSFLGVLVALVLAGTALDYRRRRRCSRLRRHRLVQAAKQQQQQQQQQDHHHHHHHHHQQGVDNGNSVLSPVGTGRTPSSGSGNNSTWTRNTLLLDPHTKAGRSNAAAATAAAAAAATTTMTWATNGVEEEGKDIGPHLQQQQQQHQMELGGEGAAGHSSSGRSSERDFLEHGEDPARQPLLPLSSSSSSSRVGNQNPAHFRRSSSSPSRPFSNVNSSSNTRGSLNEVSIAGESGNSRRQDGQNAGHNNSSSNAADDDGDKTSSWRECLECFSLMLNMDKLVAPPRVGDEFGALDGVRTLSMMWVVLGHVLIYALSGPGFTNTVDVLPRHGAGLLARLSAQVLPGGFLAVDTFFLMSGFILSSVLLAKLGSGSLGRWRWIAKAYLHRYLRLTPTLAFTTFFMWKVLPLLGEGPGWWPTAAGQADRCRRYWWAEITYLSNVVPWPPLATGCLGVSWYLSNDTMFFVAGVPLVALYHSRPRAAVAVAFATMAASCGYTLLRLGFGEDVRFAFFNAANGNGWVEAYSTPWTRCPVYLVGLLCGFAWHTNFRGGVNRGRALTAAAAASAGGALGAGDDGDIDGGGNLVSAAGASSTRRGGVEPGEEGFLLRHGKTAAATPGVVVVASVILLALPVYGSYWAYQDLTESSMPPWADHLYLAFSRPAWALGVALMCALCFLGRGGFVEWVLTRPSWTTPSRLTYCAYLAHPCVLTVMYGWRETAVRLTWVELSVTYMGVLVGTFAAATALHLVVEAPFRNLESWARRSGPAGGRNKRREGGGGGLS